MLAWCAASRLKKVADAAKCSESFISKLENDKASPSFTMLHRLTAILGANVAALFAAATKSGMSCRIGAPGP